MVFTKYRSKYRKNGTEMVYQKDWPKEATNKYLSGTRKKQELFRRVYLSEILNVNYRLIGYNVDIKRVNTYKDRREK